MLRLLFQSGRQRQQLLFRNSMRSQIGHDRLSLGQRTGLVHDDGVDLMQLLQRFRRLEEHAQLRAAARTDHDRHRRRQSQRARAGNDQHRNADAQRVVHRLSKQQPDDRRRERDAHHDRYEHARNLIRKPRDGRFGAARLLDQPDDLRQRRVLADLLRAEAEVAGLVDGRGGDLVARLLLYRHAFAGQSALVYGGAARDHNAVHRDPSAGTHRDDIARRDLLDRKLDLFAVSLDIGRFRRQVHQLFNGLAGLALGARLKVFAERDQRQDHTGGFEIQAHRLARGNGIEAVDHTGSGADRNERIHIGRTVEQLRKAAREERAVHDQDRQQAHKLRRGQDQEAAHPVVENVRHRQADHVPHRDIHQKQQEHRRDPDAGLHVFQPLLLLRIFPGRMVQIRKLRTVALARHCVDDRLRREHIFIVLHIHASGQQIALRLPHARQLARHALHTCAASRAGHSRHIESLLHVFPLPFPRPFLSVFRVWRPEMRPGRRFVFVICR